MKNTLLLLCSLMLTCTLSAQKKRLKLSDNVASIKEQIYVLTNKNGDFWTKIGVEKGKEYLQESVFLDEGDQVAYFMQDIKNTFAGTFSSEEGLIAEVVPQKKGEAYVFRGLHTVKNAGDFFWRFDVLDKESLLHNPQLMVVLSKRENQKFRTATELQAQMEYLLAMAPSQFIPIMGDFLEQDIKETRYSSTYLFQGSKGEVLRSRKGYHYKVALYSGESEEEAMKIRQQIEDKVKEAIKANCYSDIKTSTQPPYALYKMYYKISAKGCGDEQVEIRMYHYRLRDTYTVEVEVIFDK